MPGKENVSNSKFINNRLIKFAIKWRANVDADLPIIDTAINSIWVNAKCQAQIKLRAITIAFEVPIE